MTLIVSATNRPHSNTLKVAQYYQNELLEKGEKSDLFSLIDLPETIIKSDMYGQRSEAFQRIQEMVSKTDKFIFIIPEYNGSFPGVLKIFIDACTFPESFFGKKAALVGVSSGKYGNIRGVEHFTGICNYINLNVMPLKIHIPAINKELNADGSLFHEDTIKFCDEQMDRFTKF